MIVHLNVPDSVIMARIAGEHLVPVMYPHSHISSMGSPSLGQGI
jgi:hypothetical protein